MSGGYEHPEDPSRSITAEELPTLDEEFQRDIIVHWFGERFTDPAQETPYNGREGGYLYVWGGPYDARDEMETEFSALVSPQVIEDAIEEVEADGILEWAPGHKHPNSLAREQEALEDIRGDEIFVTDPSWSDVGVVPVFSGNAPVYSGGEPVVVDAAPLAQTDAELIPTFSSEMGELRQSEAVEESLGSGFKAAKAAHQAGRRPTFGTVEELALRAVIRAELRELREEVRGLRTQHGGIGHNHPPSDAQLAPEILAEVDAASTAIEASISRTEPQVEVVIEQTRRLAAIGAWLRRKGDLMVDEAAKIAGKGLGAALIAGGSILGAEILGLRPGIMRLIGQLSKWLQVVLGL